MGFTDLAGATAVAGASPALRGYLARPVGDHHHPRPRAVAVASVNYGHLPRDLDGALRDACPVVASYGGRDRGLRGAAARLAAALDRAGIPHDVKEYPAAGHSFLNDAPSGPLPLRPVMRALIGAWPEPASAADAWRRIEAFFGEHLGGGPA
jgi:carboxymethylenebutenolidase